MSGFTSNIITFHASKSVVLIASWFTDSQPHDRKSLAIDTLFRQFDFQGCSHNIILNKLEFMHHKIGRLKFMSSYSWTKYG